MKKRTLFTPRQIEVLKLRKGGLTQDQVAKVLGTTRESVSIIERNAFHIVAAARSTLDACQSLDAGNTLTIPERTPIFDIPRLVLVRGDVLGIRMRTTEDDILAIVKSDGRIRGHHLMSPMTLEIRPDGRLLSKRRSDRAASESSDILGGLPGARGDGARAQSSKYR